MSGKIISFPSRRTSGSGLDFSCRLDGVLTAAQYHVFVEENFAAAETLLMKALAAVRSHDSEVTLTETEADLVNVSDQVALFTELLKHQ